MHFKINRNEIEIEYKLKFNELNVKYLSSNL